MQKIKFEKPGTKFGFWEIIGLDGFDKRGNAMFKCRCLNCNSVYNVRGFSLRSGKSCSCRKCRLGKNEGD